MEISKSKDNQNSTDKVHINEGCIWNSNTN